MTQMVKCSQCLKELVLEQVLYHSEILEGNHVEHVCCNAECSHNWRMDNNKHKERYPQKQWPQTWHGG